MSYNGKVAVIAWQYKRPLYFVTSMFINAPEEQVLRFDPTEHRCNPVDCPKAVKSYNAFMGHGQNYQMTRLQKCRCHYKWPQRLVMKFFMWAASNV